MENITDHKLSVQHNVNELTENCEKSRQHLENSMGEHEWRPLRILNEVV